MWFDKPVLSLADGLTMSGLLVPSSGPDALGLRLTHGRRQAF